ncbi:adenylate/guanylate cyclase domain-containing protein [Paenibacillus sp.]|uniref:adenylate/guanylate cyclase domain-containing protein n=1 Tax=Paenibacillus sp. TaxID=58172 RepID=UPI002D260D40|nr:adenylate/guanylate cyclase domain-containing protein [Paenibacillus sp.]HZG56994.1 adenylate/guanylate cyclase domain-containing protein [Paenibacillus sp.]
MNEGHANAAERRFVPRELLTYLKKESIDELRLDDHVRLDMTVLFSDIRSFTTLSERLTPEETFRFLNSYLSRMEPSVEAFGGFIDKFIGDSIMALFGKSADDAVRASLHMLAALREYNLGRLRAGYEPIRIGIGLNSGPLLLGVVGGERRLQGTVIGDAVNVASRVEALNKAYGTTLLLTGHTVDRLEDPSRYAMRRIATVQIRGRRREERIYELFEADAPDIFERKARTKAVFEQALRRYEEGAYAEAKLLFRDVSDANRFDLVSRAYLARCDAPPPGPAAEPERDPDIGAALKRNERRLDEWIGASGDGGNGRRASAALEERGEPPELLLRLLEASRIYFSHHLGLQVDPDRWADVKPVWTRSAPLLDMTACVFLDGAIGGGLLVSIDIEGALLLLHRMSFEGWSAEEEMPLLMDALGEALNIVSGNSLRMFQHYADFVTIDPPVVRRTFRSELRPPEGVWSCETPLGEGSIRWFAAL